MFNALEARKISDLNDYKFELKKDLTLKSILSKIKIRAEAGYSSLDVEYNITNPRECCITDLIGLKYKAYCRKGMLYIRW